MRHADPRTTLLIEAAARALDLVIALPPPGFGGDRAARIRLVREIDDQVHTLRKARRPSPKPPLPSSRELDQLIDLSGRHFARMREAVAGRLQAYIDALDAQPRKAPENVRNALRTIAREHAEPIIQDADEAWRAFHAGGFKAAVVMAGATLEGALQAAVARIGKPGEVAYRNVYPARKVPADADSYGFEEALGVLRHVGLLTSAVSHVARGIKELRNFIHPAVQKRQRGTVSDTRALLGLQAVAAVVEELAERLQLD
jgi:hypothetical protein